jgi:uncharacterized membrane protein YedE/YeeE
MLVLGKRLASAILYDEAMAQRLIAAVLFGIGTVLENGGTIPGSSVVIPGLASLYAFGTPIKLAGVYLGAGGKLSLPEAPPERP